MNTEISNYMDGWSISFGQISEMSRKLEENGLSLAEALAGEVTNIYSRFIESEQYRERTNLSLFRMQPRLTEYLDAQDVVMGEGRNYLLFSCPLNVHKAGLLFDAALQAGVSLFVSLLESCEATDMFNNYWQPDQLAQIVTPGGWQFMQYGSQAVATGNEIIQGMEPPQIIETVILAKNVNGEERVLRHLHYEHWVDQTRVPNMPLFQLFLDCIDHLQSQTTAPFAINCYGGVGRTGVTALSHYLRREVDSLLERGCDPYNTQINIPRLVFEFKKQRSVHFLNYPGQIADVYCILEQYLLRKIREREEAAATFWVQAFAGMSITHITAPSQDEDC